MLVILNKKNTNIAPQIPHSDTTIISHIDQPMPDMPSVSIDLAISVGVSMSESNTVFIDDAKASGSPMISRTEAPISLHDMTV